MKLVIFSERSFEALLTVDCTKISGSIELDTLTLIKLKNIIEITNFFLNIIIDIYFIGSLSLPNHLHIKSL